MLALLCCFSPGPASQKHPVDVHHYREDAHRLEFSQVMAKGPQRFMPQCHLDPHSVKAVLSGWRIGGFAPNSGFCEHQSILVGDIIVSVNEEPLERPEQFMRAWEVVRNASTVTVKAHSR